MTCAPSPGPPGPPGLREGSHVRQEALGQDPAGHSEDDGLRIYKATHKASTPRRCALACDPSFVGLRQEAPLLILWHIVARLQQGSCPRRLNLSPLKPLPSRPNTRELSSVNAQDHTLKNAQKRPRALPSCETQRTCLEAPAAHSTIFGTTPPSPRS